MAKNEAVLRFLRIALAISFIGLSGFTALFNTAPNRSLLGAGTDHISDYSTALLFVNKGFEIYKKPIQEICPYVQPDRSHPETLSGCTIPERQGRRLLVIGWRELPRVYPPLTLLLFAPEALLYDRTSLSFETINVLSIIKLLLLSHCFVYFLAGLLIQQSPIQSLGDLAMFVSITWIAYFCTIWAAARGFPDPVGAWLVTAALALQLKKKTTWALFLYSVALCFHFRALWFLPFFVLTAIVEVFKNRRRLSVRQSILIASSIVLVSISLYSLRLMSPYLSIWPKHNPLYSESSGVAFHLLLPLLGLILLWFYFKAWNLAITGAWQTLLLTLGPHVVPYHAAFLLPFFPLGMLVKKRRHLILATIIAFYWFQTSFVMGSFPFQATLGRDLIRQWEIFKQGGLPLTYHP